MINEIKKKIGSTLKEYRQNCGLTQKQLGIMCGYKESTADVRINQYETGQITPKEDMLDIILEQLKIPKKRFISDITGKTDINESNNALLDFFCKRYGMEKTAAVNILLRQKLTEWALQLPIKELSEEDIRLLKENIIPHK